MLWILNVEPIWTVLQLAPFSGLTLTLTVPLLGAELSEPSWTVLQPAPFSGITLTLTVLLLGAELSWPAWGCLYPVDFSAPVSGSSWEGCLSGGSLNGALTYSQLGMQACQPPAHWSITLL